MTVFLDTSVMLRRLLRQPGRLESWDTWKRVYASDLLRLECHRAFDRYRLLGQVDDQRRSTLERDFVRLSDGIGFLPLSEEVLNRAMRPFPTVIGALDALHLATALIVREQQETSVRIATHDLQMQRAAISLGFDVEGA